MRRAFADAARARPAAALGVGPGEIEILEIAAFQTGVGVGQDGPRLVMQGITYPRHPITALLDHGVAEFLRQAFFIQLADQLLVAAADGAIHAIDPLQTLFGLIRLGDVLTGADQPRDASARIHRRFTGGVKDAHRVIGAHHPIHDVVRRAVFQGILHRLLHPRSVVRVDAAEEKFITRRDLAGRETEDAEHLVGPAYPVGDDIPFPGAQLKDPFDLFESALLITEIRLLPALLGDVFQDVDGRQVGAGGVIETEAPRSEDLSRRETQFLGDLVMGQIPHGRGTGRQRPIAFRKGLPIGPADHRRDLHAGQRRVGAVGAQDMEPFIMDEGGIAHRVHHDGPVATVDRGAGGRVLG